MIELDVIDAPGARAEGARGARGGEAPKERFWRSWGDLTGHPDHQKIARNEFMDGVIEGAGDSATGDGAPSGEAKPPSGPSRREFFKLMGASMALAGLTACRRPVEQIVPYVRQPEEVVPGIPLFYATSMPFRGVVRGLLVESHEGRPTKVEGNPEHPANPGGATSGFAQASVLNLYDPWRSVTVHREGGEATWADFMGLARRLAARAGQTRMAVLIEETASPTVAALRQQMQQAYPQLRWIPYAPEGGDAERLGIQQAFGQPYRPRYRFDEAEAIVSLDADFLGPTERDFIGNTRRFAQSRRPGEPETDGPEAGGTEMSRLYAVESNFSLTGGQADNRLPMPASRIAAFAQALAAELGLGGGSADDLTARERAFLGELAADLRQAGARGLLVAGDTQPPAVHALCMAVNSRLGGIGTTVELLDTGREPQEAQPEALAALARDMQAGQVDVLLTIGANPVYDLPPALGFAEAMQQVDETIHVGLFLDETAQRSRWHVPRTHYLEQWGDGRAYDGTLSVIQPLIEPLYADAHSEIEVLNALATGLDEAGYDLVRETWRTQLGGQAGATPASAGAGFEQAWRRVLHDGYLPDTQYPTVQAAAGAPGAGSFSSEGGEGLEVVFRIDPTVQSGEFANNAWMQELPDPVTKITWDNVALLSRRTAEQLGVGVEYSAGEFYADVIEIAVEGRTITLPVWVQPGYPDGSIGVTFGYGRALDSPREVDGQGFFARLWDAYDGVYESAEPLANDIGINVNPLRTAVLERIVTGASAQRTGATYAIASAQEHGSMEGRPIVRRATVEEYRQNPNFADDAVHMLPGVEEESWDEYPMLWEDRHPSDQPAYADSDYFENQWGMVIDLNACTGCNACVIACQSENNIQVVGKEEVMRGREMHWLRLDRYYVSPAPAAGENQDEPEGGDLAVDEELVDEEQAYDNPQMVVQPMLCQHCENAPCESVCPVAATVHSPDGTNQMVYNRCIGTRYCSNNCPYKVRRFNFFNWAHTLPQTVQMAMNPDVTVRFRGVMEKCSFCVQRIRGAQQEANKEGRPVRDGEVRTACQQVCPAEAITFGDLNNPESAVVRAKARSRRYEALAQLNVQPRLSYLGRVTNPNTALTPADGPAGSAS